MFNLHCNLISCLYNSYFHSPTHTHMPAGFGCDSAWWPDLLSKAWMKHKPFSSTNESAFIQFSFALRCRVALHKISLLFFLSSLVLIAGLLQNSLKCDCCFGTILKNDRSVYPPALISIQMRVERIIRLNHQSESRFWPKLFTVSRISFKKLESSLKYQVLIILKCCALYFPISSSLDKRSESVSHFDSMDWKWVTHRRRLNR